MQLHIDVRKQTPPTPLRAVLGYAVFAGFWIFVSDYVVSLLFHDPAQVILVSTFKGWLFVAVTSLLLYGLIQRLLNKAQAFSRREDEAKLELARTYQLLAEIADSSSDAIFAKDLEGHYLLFNREASRATGKNTGQVLGCDDTALFPGAEAEMVRANDQRVMAENRIITYEESVSTPAGTITYLATKGPLHDVDGHVVGLFGISRDITERKLTEEALKNSEERMRLFFERQLVGMAIMSPQKGWLQVNDKLCEILGYCRDELDCLTWTELTHPDDVAADIAQFERVLAGEINEYSLEKRFIRKDGEIVYAALSVGCVRKHDGSVDYVLALLSDTTERKLSEIALLESEERYHQLFETETDAVILMDCDNGYFIDVNAAAEKMYGYSRAEFTTQLRIVDVSAEPEQTRTAIDEEESFVQTRWHRRKDGSKFPVEIAGSYFTKGEQRLHVAVIRDISARREAEVELQASKAELQGILGSTSDAILAVDLNGRVIHSNRQFAELWQIPQRLLDTRDDHALLEFVVDQLSDPDVFLEKVQTLYKSDIEDIETLVFKDGRLFERCSSPLLLNGSIAGRVWSFRDITRRKRAEAQLRIAEIAFESQEGIVVTDADNIILRVNRAFTDITGYSAEEAVGQTPSLLKSGRHDAAFYAGMWESLRDRGAWQGEIWNRRKNGETYPEWLTISSVKDDAGKVINYVAMLTDITPRKEAEERIHHLACYDPLTQLPNRRLLQDRLRQALASSTRSGHQGALLFCDLDNFKTLNDTLGHDIGDQLLQQVAQRLLTCVREGDTVARLGGDEFVIVLEGLSENREEAANQTKIVGEKIMTALRQPYLLAGHRRHSTPSIGIAVFVDHQNSIDELLKRADFAMYQAKAAGRNTLCFFDPEMQAAVMDRVAMEADLREAVRENQFLLYYQPQLDGAGHMTSAEALVRWQHPRRGLVSPADFIPLTEETGLIMPLGHWVLETACAQLVAWMARPEMAHLTLAVNVSARQFHNPDFVEQVLAVLDQTGAYPHKLKLELTESMLLNNMEDIITKMTNLKAQGVGFSLDDFGTGYSSLSYLKRLPLDQLKIDQSFVRDILTDSNDAAIARTIVTLAQSMGLGVIAEGVETKEQMEFLANLGCHAYQGYLFGRPVPAEMFGR